MSLSWIVSVFCDGCGNWTEQEHTAKEARKKAKAKKWVHRNGKDYCCPDCVPARKP